VESFKHLVEIKTVILSLILCSSNTYCKDAPTSEKPDEPPKFSEVEQTVKGQLVKSKDYKPGDILSGSQVRAITKELADIGWEISDRKDIEGQALADGDFLVKQLRTKKGTKFMRRIASLPGGYDRVDRLRKMPYGNRRIRELIAGPDGFKLIQYMTTSKTGLNLGKQLSRGKNGKGFNKSTGHIYTEKDLLKRLKASYEKDFSEAIKKPGSTFKKENRTRR
jgi:hypothetical protein